MKAYLLTTLENSRNYTLSVARAMKEQHYGTKPADVNWSFGELMNHIAYGIQWWELNFIRETKTPWAPPATGNSRDEALDLLEKAYDSLKTTIDNAAVTDQLVAGFQATIDHITHHRGQAVIYLRNKGITPPEYTY